MEPRSGRGREPARRAARPEPRLRALLDAALRYGVAQPGRNRLHGLLGGAGHPEPLPHRPLGDTQAPALRTVARSARAALRGAGDPRRAASGVLDAHQRPHLPCGGRCRAGPRAPGQPARCAHGRPQRGRIVGGDQGSGQRGGPGGCVPHRAPGRARIHGLAARHRARAPGLPPGRLRARRSGPSLLREPSWRAASWSTPRAACPTAVRSGHPITTVSWPISASFRPSKPARRARAIPARTSRAPTAWRAPSGSPNSAHAKAPARSGCRRPLSATNAAGRWASANVRRPWPPACETSPSPSSTAQPAGVVGNQPISGQDRDRDQHDAPDEPRDRHDSRGRPDRAEPLHREQISRVERRRGQSERISCQAPAPEPEAPAPETGRPDHAPSRDPRGTRAPGAGRETPTRRASRTAGPGSPGGTRWQPWSRGATSARPPGPRRTGGLPRRPSAIRPRSEPPAPAPGSRRAAGPPAPRAPCDRRPSRSDRSPRAARAAPRSLPPPRRRGGPGAPAGRPAPWLA